MTNHTVRAHVLISGRVQGVYFRGTTAEEARALGLAGWVRNIGEDVEAVFEGSRSRVEQMVEWCHHGPERAAVAGVETRWEEAEGITGFRVRPTA